MVDNMESLDGSKQYFLKWEEHAFNLATEAGCFFEDESFLDCTLSAEGQCIEAHKIILSASSSYLSSLLKLMPDKHPILIFNDMKFEQLKSLVAFIYNGSVNILENDIHAFLSAAQSLLIKGLYEEDRKEKSKTADYIKKNKRCFDVFDVKKNKFYERIYPVDKPEIFQGANRCSKKERQSLPKDNIEPQNECENSLLKLQEISFTKFINQNLNSKPLNKMEGDQYNDLSHDKIKEPEKYIVKSWKHSTVDDINGRNKQNKNISFKRLKLEKKNVPIEHDDVTGNSKIDAEYDTSEGRQNDSERNEFGLEDKMKKEDAEAEFFVEPKREIIEEEDTNSDIYDRDHNSGLDMCASDANSTFDSRSVTNYYHQRIVDAGIPVPLLMCKTSLNESDATDSNWASQANTFNFEYSSQPLHHDNVQDSQCRSCSQDLPCPTCTKKYKSRYALNRHILYECGKARKSFSCDECGKKVTRQDTLQKHKLIHLVQHLKDKESEPDTCEKTKVKKKT